MGGQAPGHGGSGEQMPGPPKRKKVRVLVVDDSALVRRLLARGLGEDPDLEVVGTARDSQVAWELLVTRCPDVILLDIEMPGMDGVTFLKRYMPLMPTPAVILSALTERGKHITIQALEAGAVDVVTKPRLGVVDELPAMMAELRARVKAAAAVDVTRSGCPPPGDGKPLRPVERGGTLPDIAHQVIAIGASAGGVAALTRIIPAFPPTAPGILVVQHMPAGFTASFAARLDSLASVRVKEAEHGDRVRPGLVLLAPGGERHMEVRRAGGDYRVVLTRGKGASRHTPSVDVLFLSLARHAGPHTAAALLTGMGKDGAEGLLAIRQAGGRTFVQDERTSVVFGMPRAAWARGAAEELVPLDEIPARLMSALRGQK